MLDNVSVKLSSLFTQTYTRHLPREPHLMFGARLARLATTSSMDRFVMQRIHARSMRRL
jgi:hypothetical protein